MAALIHRKETHGRIIEEIRQQRLFSAQDFTQFLARCRLCQIPGDFVRRVANRMDPYFQTMDIAVRQDQADFILSTDP